MSLDLLALGLDVEFVQVGSSISPEVRRVIDTEIEFNIEATCTDRKVAFGAVMEVVLDLFPGLLQRSCLLPVPLRAVYLLTSLRGASQEAS